MLFLFCLQGKAVPMPQVGEGETVNPDDVLDLNANAKELRKAHTRLKMDVERYMGDLKHIMAQVWATLNTSWPRYGRP